jgi:SpoVK/Ycf46/Vps4 family AAA+-type ATPase
VTATNHPELLDRAAWRRFQLRLHLPAPTPALAQEWFRRFEERLGVKLGHSAVTLAKRLNGLSFSGLEQFSLDVQRQYVLQIPDGDIRGIVSDRLQQWQRRFSVRTQGENA